MIVFIRHAQTIPDPDLSVSEWRLSDEAFQTCTDLAQGLQEFNLNCLVTSSEFKAKETGRLIADILKIPCKEVENLHEHERKNVSFMDNKTFQKTIQNFFARPDELMFGQETARQAFQRFDKAVKNVLQIHSEPIGIVTHASVLSLFIAHYNALDAYTFWQQLKMPDKIVTNSDFKLPNQNQTK